MKKITWSATVSLLFYLATATAAPAQVFTVLVNFNGLNGESPWAALVQGTDGNFYGTTSSGGATDDGTIFQISPAGMLRTLHSFDGTDGNYPTGGLVQSTDGSFYGTTYPGGANNYGTVFKITPRGRLTTLHSFNGGDGAYPFAGLIQANGNFYGTTVGGGTNCLPSGGCGTVFKITPPGMLTSLYSFCSKGGITRCRDGNHPYSTLVQGTDGDFYGTTANGGTNDDGTVFKITPSGRLTTLHSFNFFTDGAAPLAGLIQGTDGNFYGTTWEGGAGDAGTVFQLTPAGRLTTLHSFANNDGYHPAALIQGTDGNFYGTTQDGGNNYDGTVFSLDMGLGPFVKTLPTVAYALT